jgi:hypothetical protein
VRGTDGYLRVDFGRLGLHRMTWDEWKPSRGAMAKGLKRATSPSVTATQMSNAEMDKMTAALMVDPRGAVAGQATSNAAVLSCSGQSMSGGPNVPHAGGTARLRCSQ